LSIYKVNNFIVP